jgi:uncharacterized protein (TIGR02246 family)
MEDGIRSAAAALAGAVARGDAAGVAALYADDGKLLTAAAELIDGRREIEAYWRAGLAVGLSSIELDVIELEVARPVAIEIGRYVLALRGVPAPAAERGKYVVLHRRQADGAWRRAVEVFNPDVPDVVRRRSNEEQRQQRRST